jgi:uncharacterized SAM-binding protein YcdF (DUF218 family)
MTPVSAEEMRHAKVLWSFHQMPMSVDAADFVLAMGSHDERVAVHASQLVLNGLAPILVTSGGYGKVTSKIWNETEGRRFAKIALDMGVSPSRILVEDEATNTGHNVILSCRLLNSHGIHPVSGIIVTKPYMARRAYATAAKQRSDIKWTVSTPDIEFEKYSNDEIPLRRMISLMVGDLQRLVVYAEQGFQIPQEIPDETWASYEFLRDAGYDEFVLHS